MYESFRAHVPANVLQQIELFQHLPEDELEHLSSHLRPQFAPRGTVVFKRGDPGDALYIVESGQVAVQSNDGMAALSGATLGPGSAFGETSLLTGEPRTRTLIVSIDAVLWVLSKEDFDEALQTQPAIALNLSRSLARRLQVSTGIDMSSTRESFKRLIGVAGTEEQVLQLAEQVASYSLGEVLVLDVVDSGDENSTVDPDEPFHDVVPVFERVSRLGVQVELSSGDFSEVVSQLLRRYDHLMVRFPDYRTDYVNRALDLCEVAVAFGRNTNHWISSDSMPPDRVWSLGLPGEPGYDRGRHERDRDRLARRLVGRRVGLALSSGGAHGLAHIGVLKVLEEEKIPVDFVGGTSMGSVIGSAYAAGRRGKELYRVGVEVGRMFNLKTGWRFWDPAFSRSGVLRGERFKKQVERWTYGKSFEELEVQLFLVAAEVVSGRRVVFHEGLVADGVRASVSVPLMIKPVPHGKDFLFDGACIDPVPCEPLASAGANVIIACNVIPQVEDRLYRGVRQRVGPGQPPRMLDVYNSEREIMSAQVAIQTMKPFDVLIAPKVGMYNWTEGNRIDTFIKIGEEAARAAIPQIRELLKPGVRAAGRVWV